MLTPRKTGLVRETGLVNGAFFVVGIIVGAAMVATALLPRMQKPARVVRLVVFEGDGGAAAVCPTPATSEGIY